jgi:hypothetical protein
MTINIPRQFGYEICAQCPYSDCIGDQNCIPIRDAAHEHYRQKRIIWKQEALDTIKEALAQSPDGYLAMNEAAATAGISIKHIHSFKQQGLLICQKVGAGKNSLRLVGVK